MSKVTILAFASIFVGAIASAAATPPEEQGKLIRTTITSPDPSGSSIMLSEDWALTFRLEVQKAVAVLFDEPISDFPSRGALVMRDADDCLDMSDFFADGGSGVECDFPIDNETYIAWADGDVSVSCTPFEPVFLIPNHPYLLLNSKIRAVGPRSESCSGYHESVDFMPRHSTSFLQNQTKSIFGLVVMADVGGSRIFDEHFDLIGFTPDGLPVGPWDPDTNVRAIRNMAGFVDYVGIEYLDRKNVTALSGTIQIDGQFAPIILVDGSVADPGIGFLYRRESGPIIPVRTEEVDSCPIDFRCEDNDNAVTVRIVVVEGPAPLFIVDANRDGDFTSGDLEARGFKLLSNQAEFRVKTRFDTDLATDRFTYSVDLDGDGLVCPEDGGEGIPTCEPDFDSARGGTRVRR